jgi:K+-transporting ATPase A subunit
LSLNQLNVSPEEWNVYLLTIVSVWLARNQHNVSPEEWHVYLLTVVSVWLARNQHNVSPEEWHVYLSQNVTQNVTHLIEQNVGYHYMQTYTKKPQ